MRIKEKIETLYLIKIVCLMKTKTFIYIFEIVAYECGIVPTIGE